MCATFYVSKKYVGDLKMDINLGKVMKGLGIFVAVAGGVLISYMVILLILGVVADLATSGVIDVHPEIQTLINNTVTAMSGTWFVSLNSGFQLLFSLVVLVIVIAIFAAFIYFQKKKKNGGNY